jgi:hypothetical protein
MVGGVSHAVADQASRVGGVSQAMAGATRMVGGVSSAVAEQASNLQQGLAQGVAGEGAEEQDAVSIGVDDFLAWMNSGNEYSERIRAHLRDDHYHGFEYDAGAPADANLVQLFAHIDDDGSGDLDEGEIAGFLAAEVCHYMAQPLVELYGGCVVVLKVSWCGTEGMGTAAEISQILLDTGLRHRGIGSFLCLITPLRSYLYGGLYGGLYERAHIIRYFPAPAR